MNFKSMKAIMQSRKVLKQCEKRGKEFEKEQGRKPSEKEAEDIAWNILTEVTGLSRELLEEIEHINTTGFPSQNIKEEKEEEEDE